MTWDEFAAEVRALADKVSGKPDMVVGVVRGGVIPAALIARALGVKEVYTLRITKDGEEKKVVPGSVPGAAGKRVLLVEDMLETGRTLIAGKAYLEAEGALVETACLYTMAHSEIVPDYSLKRIDAVARFPWESL